MLCGVGLCVPCCDVHGVLYCAALCLRFDGPRASQPHVLQPPQECLLNAKKLGFQLVATHLRSVTEHCFSGGAAKPQAQLQCCLSTDVLHCLPARLHSATLSHLHPTRLPPLPGVLKRWQSGCPPCLCHPFFLHCAS